MTGIVLDCPHCAAPKMTFTIFFDRLALGHEDSSPTKVVRSLMACNSCGEYVVGVFVRTASAKRSENPSQLFVDPRNEGWELFQSYPKAILLQAPEYIGDILKSFYMQAAEALQRRSWDASGAMSRKVVDVSAKQLLKEEAAKYRNMNDRIDALGRQGRLTPDLQAWAHEVRLGGNDAAHDEDPFTLEEAAELLAFVELYLTYVYTLPGRLTARRGSRSGSDSD